MKVAVSIVSYAGNDMCTEEIRRRIVKKAGVFAEVVGEDKLVEVVRMGMDTGEEGREVMGKHMGKIC